MHRDKTITADARLPVLQHGTFDHGMVSRFNAWFFSAFAGYLNDVAHHHKQAAFSGIERSSAILEIGAGAGANLHHLPADAHLYPRTRPAYARSTAPPPRCRRSGGDDPRQRRGIRALVQQAIRRPGGDSSKGATHIGTHPTQSSKRGSRTSSWRDRSYGTQSSGRSTPLPGISRPDELPAPCCRRTS
jgi:hypothetical protein